MVDIKPITSKAKDFLDKNLSPGVVIVGVENIGEWKERGKNG